MIYGVCDNCSHTQDLKREPFKGEKRVYQQCFSCGARRYFRVVRQIEQPDGSVIEVIA
jgi:uncharacterized Zn finger protein